MNSKIQTAIIYLKQTGVVPLDLIYELVANGVDFSELEQKHSVII